MTYKFPTVDLANCARRELMRRRRDYPRLVAGAKMNKAEAESEIDMMAEIAEIFEAWTKTHRQ
jgi:hypothetical protein